jgi:hypothetical protein
MARMGHFEPVVAEALTIFQATVFYKELGLHHILLEGNAFQVVKAVTFKYLNLSRFGQLVKDTRIVLNSYSNWQIHHIFNRIANNVAHELAKVVVKRIIDQVLMK